MGKGQAVKFRKPPFFKFDVADWLGDKWVKLMNGEQRGWYISMLAESWSASNTCYLPNDPEAIEIAAGLRPTSDSPKDQAELERFRSTGQIVLNRFEVTPDGKFIINERLLHEYEDLLCTRMRLQKAGIKGARGKWNGRKKIGAPKPDGQATATPQPPHGQARQKEIEVEKEIEAEKGKSQNPGPRKKRADADPRFKLFIDSIHKYWTHKNGELPFIWDDSEGKALNLLLHAQGQLTVEQFRGCLNHRARSEVVHSERPRVWLANVSSYAGGPLDRYGKLLEGSGNGTYQQNKPGGVSSADARLARIVAKTTAASAGRAGPTSDRPAIGDAGDDRAGHLLVEGETEPIPN